MDIPLQEKIRKMEQLVSLDPTDHTGLFLLGKLYLDANEYLKGAATFERCIETNPDYTAAYRFCGDCHRRAGDYAQAREVYLKGIEVARKTGDMQAGREMEAFLRKLEHS